MGLYSKIWFLYSEKDGIVSSDNAITYFPKKITNMGLAYKYNQPSHVKVSTNDTIHIRKKKIIFFYWMGG